VNRSAALVALVPPSVVTMTSTGPVPGGEAATMVVELLMMYESVSADPKATAVAPVRFVPVMVTDVPPPLGPEFGLTEVTLGGGTPAEVAVMKTFWTW